jgi:hypothetical protein
MKQSISKYEEYSVHPIAIAYLLALTRITGNMRYRCLSYRVPPTECTDSKYELRFKPTRSKEIFNLTWKQLVACPNIGESGLIEDIDELCDEPYTRPLDQKPTTRLVV